MQTKYLCVLIHIWIKGEVVAPLNGLSTPVKYFTDRSKGVLFCGSFMFLFCRMALIGGFVSDTYL